MASRLTWEQAAAWRFARHGLLERDGPDAALDVVARIAGLHAQVMSSAELSLHARVDDLPRDWVAHALWKERTLVKTWAMRGTLHLLPESERGLWRAALSTYSSHSRDSWLRAYGVSREGLETLLGAVGAALREDGPLTRTELADAVAARTGDAGLAEKVHGSWGPFLKPAAFRGDLCFAPSSGRNVRFAHPDVWLGDAAPMDPAEALREVARRYLGAYGPASREDLSRWWAGVTAAGAQKLLESLGEEVAVVDVEGRPSYLLARHVEEVLAVEPTRTVRLLPAFDPYVAGAPREGLGIFPAARRPEIYRTAGWLTPVVVIDGVIAGVFTTERKGARLVVAVRPFAALPTWAAPAIEAEALRLAGWLGAELELHHAV